MSLRQLKFHIFSQRHPIYSPLATFMALKELSPISPALWLAIVIMAATATVSGG
jgi:hypothetical protein